MGCDPVGDVESTGDRGGCSRILMGTMMEGDVKAAGGFPLEAEEDVAAVEKDVGTAVGSPHFKLPDYFVRVVRRVCFSQFQMIRWIRWIRGA